MSTIRIGGRLGRSDSERTFNPSQTPNMDICNRCDRPASIECAECFSFFCSDCSDTIHSVGKWKQHSFKYLASSSSSDNTPPNPVPNPISLSSLPPSSPSFARPTLSRESSSSSLSSSTNSLVRSSSGGNSQKYSNLPPVPPPPISAISTRVFVKSPSFHTQSSLPPPPPTPVNSAMDIQQAFRTSNAPSPTTSPGGSNPVTVSKSLNDGIQLGLPPSHFRPASAPTNAFVTPPISRPSNNPPPRPSNPNAPVHSTLSSSSPNLSVHQPSSPNVASSPPLSAPSPQQKGYREASTSAPVGRGVGTNISPLLAAQMIGGMMTSRPSPSFSKPPPAEESALNSPGDSTRAAFVNGTIRSSPMNKPANGMGNSNYATMGPKRAASMVGLRGNVEGTQTQEGGFGEGGNPVKPPPKSPHKIVKINVRVNDGTHPSYGRTWELRFPSVASVGQLIQMVGKRLYGSFTPEKKEDRKGYPLLYFNDQLLDPEKAVGFYPQITKGSPIEVKKVNHEAHIIQISNEEQSTTKRVVDETTSVWSVLIQPLKKLAVKLTGHAELVSQYGLFFEGTNEALSEDDFMLNHSSKLKSKLLFKKCSNYSTDDTKLLVLYKDQFSLDVNSTSNIHSILRKFAKVTALKENAAAETAVLRTPSLFEYAFQIPPEDETDYGVWMEDWEPLSSYSNRLKENQLVELKLRSKQFDIDLPDGTTYSLNVDSLTQVFEVLNLLVSNLPDLFPDASEEYQLAIPGGGGVLSTERTIWSYNSQKLVVNRIAKPLIVFYNSKQVLLSVDFSIPVIKLMMQMWIAFGINPKKEGEFSLRRMSPDIEIDLKKSLLQQSVHANSAISLRITQNENTEFVIRNDVSIWAEESTPSTCVIEDKLLAAGTLNQVVKQMTSETNPHPEFRQAALMTLHSFTTPQAMIIKLLERFNVPIPAGLSQEEVEDYLKKKVGPIQLSVGGALKAWLKHHPSDFDHEITQIVTNFCDTIPPYLSVLATQIQNSIVERTCNMKSQTKTAQPTRRDMFPQSQIKNRSLSIAGPHSIFESDELEVARQFSLIDSQYFNAILPKEFLNQNWSKNQGVRAPNVLKLIERMNAVSNWIASEILEPARVKVRALRFTRLIKIADHLRTLNNFGTLMAFLGGFNNASVSRLRFTKQLLPKKAQDTLMALETLMSTDNASKAYRTTLSLASPPGVPYVGLHLIDLTFTDEGNQDLITEHKLINMTKRILTFRIIMEMERFKFKQYLFLKVPGIESQIKDLPIHTDEKALAASLYDISLSREPRGAEKVV